MQIKVIFIRMVSHLDSLWNRGTRELGNGQLHFSYLTFSINCFMLPDFAHGSSWHENWIVHWRRTYALDIYNESHMRPPHEGPSAHFPSTIRDLRCLHDEHCSPGLPTQIIASSSTVSPFLCLQSLLDASVASTCFRRNAVTPLIDRVLPQPM